MISNIYNSYNNTNLLKLYFNNRSQSIPKSREPIANNTIKDKPQIKSIYKDSDLSHTSWFYINDIHGKMTKMERIYNMAQQFDRTKSEQSDFFKNITDSNIAKFKVSSGDISIGCNPNNNKVAYKFLDWCGFDATELGNHEMDVVEPGDLAALIDGTKCKMLALNVIAQPNSFRLKANFKNLLLLKTTAKRLGLSGLPLRICWTE